MGNRLEEGFGQQEGRIDGYLADARRRTYRTAPPACGRGSPPCRHRAAERGYLPPHLSPLIQEGRHWRASARSLEK